MIHMYVVFALTLTYEQKTKADVNGDGKVNGIDVLQLEYYIKGLKTEYL